MTTAELREAVKQYSASVDALAKQANGEPIPASAAAGLQILETKQAI